MAGDDDEIVEIAVRLPAALARRIELADPGTRLADVLRRAAETIARVAEEAAAGGEVDAPEAGTDAAPEAGDEAGSGMVPVFAVGDAAVVLGRLHELQASVASLRASLVAGEERERRTQVWIKTVLAELFAHLSPFPTAADERERRLAAAERLGVVDRRVAAYVRNGRDLDGEGGETPPTG